MDPTLIEEWKNQSSEKYGYASNWSERHVAYISGLGTFGLSDGLITQAGKAHRCGSVVVEMALESTPREYTHYMEYCQHNKGCNACAKQCSANAISAEGHDKLKCRIYQRDTIRPYTKENMV